MDIVEDFSSITPVSVGEWHGLLATLKLKPYGTGWQIAGSCWLQRKKPEASNFLKSAQRVHTGVQVACSLGSSRVQLRARDGTLTAKHLLDHHSSAGRQ